VFGPAALAFLAFAGWSSRDAFATILDGADPIRLVLAVALTGCLHLLSPLLTWRILHELGSDLSYRTLMKIHVRRLPARYLPGGIWHTVSRAVDIRALGVDRADLSTMLVLENVIPPAVALTGGGLALLVADEPTLLTVGVSAAGVASLAAVPVAIRIVRKRWLTPSAYVRLIGSSAAFWTVAAIAFVSYWSALPAARAGVSALEMGGSYLVAWTAGFVNVFAPQGIGVFEATIGALLQGRLTFANAAILAVGVRAVTLAADCAVLAIFHVNRRRGGDPRE
jgi:hypothetical protein